MNAVYKTNKASDSEHLRKRRLSCQALIWTKVASGYFLYCILFFSDIIFAVSLVFYLHRKSNTEVSFLIDDLKDLLTLALPVCLLLQAR